jgi:hypothetical protein
MNVQRVIIIIIIVTLIYLLIDSFYYGQGSRASAPITAAVPETETNFEEEISEIVESEDSDNLDKSDSELTVKSMNNTDSPIENFRANGIGNPVIDQGTWDNAYTLLNPPHSAGGKDTMSHRLIVHQVSNRELIALITEIKAYIANTIIKFAKTCQNMHGDEVQLHDGKRGLSLACVSDPYALKDQIIDGVYEMIYQFIKSRFNINMNPYVVYHDLNMHMGLMERIIYPLQFSGLYTVHGVQYTNEDWIRNKVHDNIDVRHVLFTVFSRRNIEIEVDTDQHVH